MVGMGEFKVTNHATKLTCVGLGSCVGLVLHDPGTKTGGLAHIMLPHRSAVRNQENPSRFADTSVALMIHELECLGAERRGLRAKLYGGADMFSSVVDSRLGSIGDRNIEALHEELGKQKIKIAEEDLGGTVGRTIVFDPRDGSVQVRYARRPHG